MFDERSVAFWKSCHLFDFAKEKYYQQFVLKMKWWIASRVTKSWRVICMLDGRMMAYATTFNVGWPYIQLWRLTTIYVVMFFLKLFSFIGYLEYPNISQILYIVDLINISFVTTLPGLGFRYPSMHYFKHVCFDHWLLF